MAKRFPTTFLSKRHTSDGFVLPLVLIVSLMLGTGMMAMAMRTWIGVKGGIRQSQSREAREIAEAGTARLLESLNRRYAHLLLSLIHI